MSIAIINASVGASLSVAGTTTLSGALTSASSISCQSIISTALQVNGVNNSTFSGIRVNGDTTLNGNLICILQKQTTGKNNIILGEGGGSVLTTGSYNNCLGYRTMEQTITGSYNTCLGFESGGGLLGSENICIGRNTGITPSNIFNQSTCIGINSQITASNQIALGNEKDTVKILGGIELFGEFLAGSSAITNTQLGFVAGTTSNIQTQLNTGSTKSSSISSNVTILQTKTTGINFSLSTTTITGDFVLTGNVSLNDNIIYLRSNDTKHSLGYDAITDGPSLQGNSGGKLGTQTNSSMLSWNTQIMKLTAPLEMTTGACIRMNGTPLYFGYLGDGETYLQASDVGASIQSKSGGRIGTTLKSDIISWNSTSGINVALNGNTNITGILNIGGNVNLNDKSIYLRGSGNTDHSLSFNLDVQGPSLQGYSGGKLGTLSKSDIVTWNSTLGVNTIGLNGNVNIPSTNEIRLNGAPIYFKSVGDNNHVLRYNGGSFDGPILQGATGGTLATVTNSSVFTWSNTSVNMNLPIICNSSIQQSQSGYCVNFYRKTSCGTSETYDFQSAHGKYDVYFNANHDRNTTAFFHVDVLNNVNNGSFVVQVYKGVSVTIAIDVNTNILTVNCAVIGGTLQINRIMSYY